METRSQEMEKRLGEMRRELGQRHELLQKRMAEQQAKTDARLEEMMQAITALSIQNQASAEKNIINIDGATLGKNEYGKATRFEFPKFDGDGFEGWKMRAEYFFEMAGIESTERVRIAALHLEGKALLWHRGFILLQGEKAYEEWDNYIRAIAARFGAHAYEDPLSDLRNLRQVSSLQAYMDEFDELYPRTSIREDQALSFFLSGLVDELQMPVRMFKPKNLADAYALAKLQELTVRAMHSNSKPRTGQRSSLNSGGYNSGTRSLTVTTANFKPPNVVGGGREAIKNTNAIRTGTRLTSKEVEERRSKGLCFWCEEKYTPNHRCSKRRAFVLQMVEEESSEEMEKQEEEEVRGEGEATDLQLSLHAMWGIEGNYIMRIRGSCQKKSMRILVDTGSTHNFLSTKMAEKLNYEWMTVKPAAVEVANGQQLECNLKCKDFEWKMQGSKFWAEVHIIRLETYDLILG